MKETNYEKLLAAKKVLRLGESATMEQIKSCYRELLHQYHPDKANYSEKECEQMTRKITEAYKVIEAYCFSYSYSFTEQDMKRYQTEEEWWYNKFGKDPVWQQEE